MPLETVALAKLAFSARKPYPGWIASAPVFSAVAIIVSILTGQKKLRRFTIGQRE